jgi:hypothetical protein
MGNRYRFVKMRAGTRIVLSSALLDGTPINWRVLSRYGGVVEPLRVSQRTYYSMMLSVVSCYVIPGPLTLYLPPTLGFGLRRTPYSTMLDAYFDFHVECRH